MNAEMLSNLKVKRVCVFGGRNFSDRLFVHKVLDQFSVYFDPDFCIIHGAATGVDSFAGEWARNAGRPCIAMPAQWKSLGGKAGKIRNAWILKWTKPDLGIAFAGTSGTDDMFDRLRAARIPVLDLRSVHES